MELNSVHIPAQATNRLTPPLLYCSARTLIESNNERAYRPEE